MVRLLQILMSEFTTLYVSNVVISVQFSAGEFFATESSMMMIVGLVISGGSSTTAVMATVQPSQLTPISATGNIISSHKLEWLLYNRWRCGF